jgi:hypothetical protein
MMGDRRGAPVAVTRNARCSGDSVTGVSARGASGRQAPAVRDIAVIPTSDRRTTVRSYRTDEAGQRPTANGTGASCSPVRWMVTVRPSE